MDIARKLTYLRTQKGCSQEDIADELGVSRQTISKWELGTQILRLDTLYKISDILEVSPSSFIQDMEPQQKEEININNEIDSLPAEQKQFVLRTIRTLLKGLQC